MTSRLTKPSTASRHTSTGPPTQPALDTLAGTFKEQVAESTLPQLQSFPRRGADTQLVEVMVLERCYGPRRLHDDEDDVTECFQCPVIVIVCTNAGGSVTPLHRCVQCLRTTVELSPVSGVDNIGHALHLCAISELTVSRAPSRSGWI